MTTEATTYDKKFNAQRGAQRTGLKPGEFEVFKTPDGRFGWRAVAEGEPAISMNDPTLAEHPIAQANAASWPSGPKTGKRKAIIEQAQAGALPAGRIFRSRRMRGFGRSSPSWSRLPRRAMSKASRPSRSTRFQRAQRPWRAIAIWRSWPSRHAVWIDETALR